MKKCASCTKDLPDAALHCVFCGAKQPPAPATAGGLAKTAFGSYSASDMIDHLKNQQTGRPAPPARPSPAPAPSPARPAPAPPAPAPYAPPRPSPAGPPPPANAYQPPANAYQPPAPSPARGHNVPAVSSAAPTMMVAPGGGPAPGNFAARPMGPMGTPHAPQPAPMSPLVMPTPAAPMQQPAMAHMPVASPPYLASQNAARAGRPIEPWKDSLRLMMFIWGGALIAAFATPLSIDPLAFNWDAIINGEGTRKLPPLIMAATGLLSIVIALIPTSPAPRGLIAGLLGLAGIVVPLVLGGMPPWQLLVPVAGLIILIPALLMRQEYRDALLPRILVTVGVIATLLIFLLPEHGQLPLAMLFTAVLDVPGAQKVILILLLAQITIVVLSLLAWLPAPSSGGGNVFAWLLILWPAIMMLTVFVVDGSIADVLTKTPYNVVAWVAGAGGGKAVFPMIGLGVGYAVLVGYGLATVIGKKLE